MTTPNPDAILDTACRHVLDMIRFGQLVGRSVPTSVLARRLSVAVDEWAAAEGLGS